MISAFRLRLVAILICGLLAVGCETVAPQAAAPHPTLSPDEVGDLHIVTGQLVFVPAYSEIFYGGSEQTLPLATTLAIHNTDTDASIIIRSVQYFDTEGNLVRELAEQPIQLGPMATGGFVIDESDLSGGWGANFLVEWVAEEPVYEPVVEAIMVSRRGTEGVSFISPGRVISEHQE
jgi:hypothetical protein